MSEEWYNGKIENLVTGDEKKKLLPYKKRDFYERSIPLSKLELEKQNGWEEKKINKTTAVIRQKKPEYERFADIVWTLLAEMGFEYLSDDHNKLKLPRGDGKYKQIDVLGIDTEDVVILSECKAAEKSDGPKRQDFDDVITDIINYRPEVTKHLNQFFNPKPKYIFLLCTSNYIVGEADQERMKKNSIFWLDSDRINYFRNLTAELGPLAKYQFLGEILEGSPIPGMKNYRVPAIRANMGDQTCYSMMIKPSVLLKMGFVLHRTDGSKRKNTYQRYVKKSRLTSVKDYIVKEHGFFPNSIIVNFDFDLTSRFQAGKMDMQGNDSNVRVGTMILPDCYKSAFIIDGQHRLYGYAGTNQKDTEVIPVIAFSKLPPEKQTNMFVDINTKAKAVKRNLIESLNGELYWNSKEPKYALSALHSMLALDLNDRLDSPLHNLIEIGDSTGKKKSEKKKDITLTYLIDNGLKKGTFFVKTYAKNGQPYSYGALYDGDLADKSLEKASKVISGYLNAIKISCTEQWEALRNNVGISTLLFMLGEFLDEKRKTNADIYSNKSAKEVTHLISDRVSLFCRELAKRDKTDVKSYLEGNYGYGGVDKSKRFFERIIHDADNSFTQEGLEEWIVEQSGKYTDLTKQILTEVSLSTINFVEKKLTSATGSSTFYEDGKFPEKIATNILKRKRAANTELDHLLVLSDIRDVILASWTANQFNEVFADPNIKGAKEERTEWLNTIVSIESKITKQEKLAQQDYKAVDSVKKWLLPKIAEFSN